MFGSDCDNTADQPQMWAPFRTQIGSARSEMWDYQSIRFLLAYGTDLINADLDSPYLKRIIS